MSELLTKIEQSVGAAGLLTGDDVAARALDWMGRGSREARAIIRPASTKEVADVLKICNEAGQSVVTHGGLTGLVQGTHSTSGDILLSMERMNKIETIDRLGKTAIVEAGAPLQKFQEAVEEAELHFAFDLGSRGSCTIGGNIATNAGGNQVLRYGMMREQLLGLEAVLADGTILSSMNALLKNNTGYDLKQLFVGSEGTLGVVTRAVLRLHPRSLSNNTALVALPSFSALTEFFALIGEKLGGGLTAFEVMWRDHYELIAVTSGRHTAPLPATHDYFAIVRQEGADPDRDSEQFAAAFELAAEKELLADAVIAQSEAQAQAIWDIREDIFGLYMALNPLVGFDVSLPIAAMEEYVSGVRRAVTKKWGDKARLIVFGHLGDGNLHVVVSVGDASEETENAIKKLVYGPLQKIGGSISAEHGVGLEKKDYLSLSRTPEEIAVMKKIKQTLDPKNVLNPGKIF